MNRMTKGMVSVILLAVSIIFIAIGISQGQHTDVMNKAIRICLECVGIG